MTELEKMLAGQIYDPSDPVLEQKRLRAHRYCTQVNHTAEDAGSCRTELLHKIFGAIGEGTYITGPIIADYGEFTTFGKRCFVNFNMTIEEKQKLLLVDDMRLRGEMLLEFLVHNYYLYMLS